MLSCSISSFAEWWRSWKKVPKQHRKDFNSLCVLGAWTLWKHRNAWTLWKHKDESQLWQFSGAKGLLHWSQAGDSSGLGLAGCALSGPCFSIFCNSSIMRSLQHSLVQGEVLFVVIGPLFYSFNTNICSSPACSRKKKKPSIVSYSAIQFVRWQHLTKILLN